MSFTDCPCHSGGEYDHCCRPYHEAIKSPDTALQLMRSRYSAYALRLVDYLIDTTHPNRRMSSLRTSLMATIHSLKWTQLTIVKTSAGQQSDNRGKVLFEATYEESGKAHVLREHSRFRKRAGRWYYYDGKG